MKVWFDNKLKWNESEYGGLREIRLPHDKIWKPVIKKEINFFLQLFNFPIGTKGCNFIQQCRHISISESDINSYDD